MRLIFWNASAPVCELQDSTAFRSHSKCFGFIACESAFYHYSALRQSGLEFCAERTIAQPNGVARTFV
jgi:hypothetical protein